ncbi:HAD family hydrolase [Candidatus Cyrtobacter comes]|uniref:phosphoglycolate phosphatase n=1 Tax=Candidatus Cyrtobacter comes TaxID=675776 RepID=A0ABU5L8B9_9RICK|nr:HAD hydrolase-like protein [Candidatus Cyrtobacter comes]MDZ5762368.1 HAD family hydrolase [Candidatus Cyrtobacter comes]
MNKKPEIIIFDWDGTLVKDDITFDTFYKTMHEMRDLKLEHIDEAMLVEYRYYPMRDSLKLIFGDNAQRFEKQYLENISNEQFVPPIQMNGAIDALNYFRENNVEMFIVSNKRDVTLRKEISYLGWEEYFSAIVGASEAQRGKPWRDPVDLALSVVQNPEKKQKWFIGDSVVDIRCAHETECVPFLINPKYDTEQLIKESGLDHVRIDSHECLIKKYKEYSA